jgi:hypothetical protein
MMKTKLALLLTVSWGASLLSLFTTPTKAFADADCGWGDVTCHPSRWKRPGKTIEDNIVKPVLGRCGVNGEAHIRVTNKLATKVFVLTDKNDAAGGPDGKELNPGESNSTPICNGSGARIKVFTPEDCGKSLLSESRYNRVYNNDYAKITESGIKFDVGDKLDVAGRVSGFALTYLAQGYGIPPQMLAEMGVNEAKLIGDCSQSGVVGAAQCVSSIYKWLPEDMLTTIKNDKCLSKVIQSAKLPDNPANNPTLIGNGTNTPPNEPMVALLPGKATFSCDTTAQASMTNLSKSANDKPEPIILWKNNHFNSSGYSPIKRCQQVSERLQNYQVEESLQYITSGKINRLPVLCVADSQASADAHQCRLGENRGLILTLQKGQSASQSLKNMKDALFNGGTFEDTRAQAPKGMW